MIKIFKAFSLAITLLATVHLSSNAQTVRIAVAANAQGVIKKLQADFKKSTGITTEAIIGASGKLTTQIMNGAPYDIFLSADTEFPSKLYDEGYGIKKPKIYALGSLIICSLTEKNLKNWQMVLSSNEIKKIAIANPKIAPYGRAASESLNFYHIANKVSSKLVFGESIAQVNTYLQTGVVEVGFTTESFLYERVDKPKIKWTRVDEKSYSKIEQGVILLNYSKKSGNDSALQFYNYLSTPAAKKIIASSGYHLPVQYQN